MFFRPPIRPSVRLSVRMHVPFKCLVDERELEEWFHGIC